MVILIATSILGRQKKDKWMMCSITPQINIWRSNGLWLYKTAMLFTLPESGAQSKESKVFVIVGTFLFVILL